MKTLLKIVLLASVFGWCGMASAKEIAAPFGLTWGMSKAEMETQGMKFSFCKDSKEWGDSVVHRGYLYDLADLHVDAKPAMTVCFMKNLPKPLSSSTGYTGWFHPTKGLIYVSTSIFHLSRADLSKEYGTDIAKEYLRLKPKLTGKYGVPWRDDEGLCAGGGCFLESSWTDNADGFVTLNTVTVSNGAGRLYLTYESKEWTQIIDDARAKQDTTEAKKTAGDDDAL